MSNWRENWRFFLLIEPEPGLLIERFEQYLEFAGRIDSPWVGLNFDIGHAYCVGEDPQDWIARMAPHTKHYHLEDIPPSREHRHMIPGRGAIDFPAVLREIAGSGYAGWVTVELYPYIDNPDQAGREAKQFIEQKFQTQVRADNSGSFGTWTMYFGWAARLAAAFEPEVPGKGPRPCRT